jgi:hypothetical protein
MIRDTSKAANDFLKAKGKDKERHESILKILGSGLQPDYSIQELAEIMKLPVNCVSGRCSELKYKKKLIEEGPRRPCKVTGFTCHPLRMKPVLMEAA